MSALSSPQQRLTLFIATAITTYGFIYSLGFLIKHSTAAWFSAEYPLDMELVSEALACLGLTLAGVMLLAQRRHALKTLVLFTAIWAYVAFRKVAFIYVIQRQVAKFNTDGALQWKLILDEALVSGVIGILLLLAIGWLSLHRQPEPAVVVPVSNG